MGSHSTRTRRRKSKTSSSLACSRSRLNSRGSMTKRLTYLDNAATTPVRPEVLDAMLPYLGKDAFGNPSSAHRLGRAARAGVEEAKRAVAGAVGAEPNQVVFTSGGTEADNLAIIGAALAARDRGGPFRVAVSAIEHKAVLAAAHAVVSLGRGGHIT